MELALFSSTRSSPSSIALSLLSLAYECRIPTQRMCSSAMSSVAPTSYKARTICEASSSGTYSSSAEHGRKFIIWRYQTDISFSGVAQLPSIKPIPRPRLPGQSTHGATSSLGPLCFQDTRHLDRSERADFPRVWVKTQEEAFNPAVANIEVLINPQ